MNKEERLKGKDGVEIYIESSDGTRKADIYSNIS